MDSNNKMTIKEAINRLKYDMEMLLFNPLTGDRCTKEQLKISNKNDYAMYLVCELAIEALREQAIKEFMEKNRDIEEIPKTKSTIEILKEIIEEAGIT